MTTGRINQVTRYSQKFATAALWPQQLTRAYVSFYFTTEERLLLPAEDRGAGRGKESRSTRQHCRPTTNDFARPSINETPMREIVVARRTKPDQKQQEVWLAGGVFTALLSTTPEPSPSAAEQRKLFFPLSHSQKQPLSTFPSRTFFHHDNIWKSQIGLLNQCRSLKKIIDHFNFNFFQHLRFPGEKTRPGPECLGVVKWSPQMLAGQQKVTLNLKS